MLMLVTQARSIGLAQCTVFFFGEFRVVVLGSELHRGVPGAPEEVALDLDDVNCDAYPDDWEAHPPCGQAAYMSYCRSKLCNVLFARQFARNLTSLRKWAPPRRTQLA